MKYKHSLYSANFLESSYVNGWGTVDWYFQPATKKNLACIIVVYDDFESYVFRISEGQLYNLNAPTYNWMNRDNNKLFLAAKKVLKKYIHKQSDSTSQTTKPKKLRYVQSSHVLGKGDVDWYSDTEYVLAFGSGGAIWRRSIDDLKKTMVSANNSNWWSPIYREAVRLFCDPPCPECGLLAGCQTCKTNEPDQVKDTVYRPGDVVKNIWGKKYTVICKVDSNTYGYIQNFFPKRSITSIKKFKGGYLTVGDDQRMVIFKKDLKAYEY